MDQRAKGGLPPATHNTVAPASPAEDSEQDRVVEKRRRGEADNGDMGRKSEEKRGSEKMREGERGAVLELLIEGRCGGAGQRQLPFQSRDTSCPDGNVRFRIGLQAKRTKKPPKILESYVCKPTIRTYQRQGRGGTLRGDGEAGVGHQEKNSPPPLEAAREQSSGLDAIHMQSKQTAPSALSTSSSSTTTTSSSSPSQPPSLPSALGTPSQASPSALASPQNKSAKQVPVKLANKAEEKSDSFCERVKRDKHPVTNVQPALVGQKPSSPKIDQRAPSAPSTPSLQTPTAADPKAEGDTQSQHNGLEQAGKQKGLSNGKGSTDICGPSKSTKVKAGKQSNASSATPRDMSPVVRSSVSSSSQKKGTDSPGSSTNTPKAAPSAPGTLPSAPSPQPDAVQPLPESNKREKEKKSKKEKRKEKKSKRDKGEADRAKGESKKEDGKKKKKGKDGKLRHLKGKDERGKGDDKWRDEAEKGKVERKRDSKLSQDDHGSQDNCDTPGEKAECSDVEKTSKPSHSGRPDETERETDTCRPTVSSTNKPAKQAEPVATGDTGKSKDVEPSSRHSVMSPSFPTAAPSSVPSLSTCSPTSSPCSPLEQDSRPLKKRKTRRPSWTKLVHRAQRVENQEPPPDLHNNPTLSPPMTSKTCLSSKNTNQQIEEAHLTSTVSSPPSSSSPLPSAAKPPSPIQGQPTYEHRPPASKSPVAPARKRGRPKSQSSSTDEPQARCSPKRVSAEVLPLWCEVARKSSESDASQSLPNATQVKATPRKRGRPPKQPPPALDDQSKVSLSRSVGKHRIKDFHSEKGNRQLKIRRLIGEMKKRKRKRLHKGILAGYGGRERRRVGEGDGESFSGVCKSAMATTTHTLSTLSSSFGGKLGPQINVSKRGTIYMGKRRGRKPKAQITNQNPSSQNPTKTGLFTTSSETSMFSSPIQHPPSHPFPSPSLTHSSGAQSPYSDGSFTEPTSSLLFPHPFSLPSPSSSCTSPRPPSSSSLSPFVKRTCPCQGRHPFPFHQSSCKISSPTPSLHHTPGSPAHLKEATPSPRSESHSEETLPSDSGIGTDNNSVSERGEIRSGRGILRIGQGTGVKLGGQRRPSSLLERPSPVSSHLPPLHRHTHPISTQAVVERHRERHRHKRREFDCVSSCPCLCPCPCPCPGHTKCTHLDYYSCLGHNLMRRQKNKHKKKHQQLLMHEPEFLSELEDLIGQFSEVHIGRRGWARSGLGQGFDGSGNPVGARRHHSSTSHPLRSNIFRINLNGFYSPHPPSYTGNPPFSSQAFYPCQPLHCGRKPDRRQCGCPSKFQDTIDDLGYYRGYPASQPLYTHLHSSYPLPPPHQYAPHQPHHPHFLLNPARFHRRRSRLLKEAGLGAEGEVEVGGGGGGGGGVAARLSSGFTSSISCGCGRSEHKHKRKHRHRHCERDVEEEEELPEDEEEETVEREGLSSSKPRSGFTTATGEGGRKGSSGTGNVGSAETSWLRKSGKATFSSSAAAINPSLSSSAGKFKSTSLTSIGLGSSHLSSFGGGWGGLGQPWMKIGVLGSPVFGLSNPHWRNLSGGQQPKKMGGSEREEEDEEDVQQAHPHNTCTSPTHTNLFTSAAIATAAMGLRSGPSSRSSGSGDRSWRKEEPTWAERRGTGTAGLQGDSSRGQQRHGSVPDTVAVKKRGPGRPRKQPLPSPAPSPTHSPLALGAPSLLAAHIYSRGEGGRGDQIVAMGGGGGSVVQQVMESVMQVKRKRGRKRKHSDSPSCQSPFEDRLEEDDHSLCFGQSELEQPPSLISCSYQEEKADSPPRKKYQRAGLYSDDYKTVDPPFQSKLPDRESLEYIPGEHEYSLMPAPIHVGKYLRLKKIDFQLPYDVLWLWRNNKLCRQPTVPLKRKRSYCRLKEKTSFSHTTTVEENPSEITNLFPHLDMEPLTSTERSFVVKHHVFLVRNWELVRERQIQLRIEREREMEGEETDACHPSCNGASEEDSHIKSGP